MEWTLPGTVLSVDADRPQAAEEVFSSLFLAGGLVLSQVTQVTGLEPYIIQNWVRRGFLAPPKQRKYTRRQLSRILMINVLKSTLSIEQICKLLSYINGALDDEGDVRAGGGQRAEARLDLGKRNEPFDCGRP